MCLKEKELIKIQGGNIKTVIMIVNNIYRKLKIKFLMFKLFN